MNFYFVDDKGSPPIKRLISYCVYKNVPISIKMIKSILEIPNDKNSFYLKSIFSYSNLISLFDEIKLLRNKYRNLEISIAIGGAGLFSINFEQIRAIYPEIKFIILGEGEDLFSKITQREIQPGVYTNSVEIESYKILPDLAKTIDGINISFDKTNCAWNKCQFCYHSSNVKINDFSKILSEVLYYYEIGVRKFNIIDNFLVFGKFYRLLDELLLRGINDVCFYLMGVHVNSNWNRMHEYVPKFKHLVTDIGVGFEFLDNEVLSLYNKGTTVEKITDFSNYFYDLGVHFSPFFLASLPKISDKNIENNFSNLDKIYHTFYHINLSHFLLSDELPIFKEQDKYEIKIKNKYDMSNHKEGLEKIETNYYNFLSYNKDRGLYLTRQQEFDRYSYLLNKQKTSLAKSTFLVGNQS